MSSAPGRRASRLRPGRPEDPPARGVIEREAERARLPKRSRARRRIDEGGEELVERSVEESLPGVAVFGVKTREAESCPIANRGVVRENLRDLGVQREATSIGVVVAPHPRKDSALVSYP